MNLAINRLIAEFVDELTDAVEAMASTRIEAAMRDAFGDSAGGVGGSVRAKRRGPVSHKRRLQGQYLGRLRSLKGAERSRVRAIARKKGVAEAVRAANKILGR
jgi:hypothetical protein